MSAKDRILASAKIFFARKGYETTSVREIAKDAKVNIAAINYHYGSKEGLFNTICREFAENKLSFAYGVLKPVQTSEELYLRLEIFFNAMLSLADDDFDTVFILLKNLDFFAENSPDEFLRIFMTPHQKLLDFFIDCQKKKLLREDLDPEIIAHIFISGSTEILRSNKIRKNFLGYDILKSEEKIRFIDTYLKCFIEGIRS